MLAADDIRHEVASSRLEWHINGFHGASCDLRHARCQISQQFHQILRRILHSLVHGWTEHESCWGRLVHTPCMYQPNILPHGDLAQPAGLRARHLARFVVSSDQHIVHSIPASFRAAAHQRMFLPCLPISASTSMTCAPRIRPAISLPIPTLRLQVRPGGGGGGGG